VSVGESEEAGSGWLGIAVPIRPTKQPASSAGHFYGGAMNAKSSIMLWAALLCIFPLSAMAKKKPPERAMLEKMDAVPCGANERGISGLGSLWASLGITHVNSNEKLCPEYVLRTDEMEYHIRPTDLRHPALLPVGHEGLFKIKKNRMLLKFEDGDGKTRKYQIVGVKPNDSDKPSNSDTEVLENGSGKSTDKP
jgi:hypothetical protein